MRRFIQIHFTRTIVSTLMITVLTLFTSCAPRYGCYYGMTETSATAKEVCSQDLVVQKIPGVEAIAVSR